MVQKNYLWIKIRWYGRGAICFKIDYSGSEWFGSDVTYWFEFDVVSYFDLDTLGGSYYKLDASGYSV